MFKDERVWRFLCNLWTVLFGAFVLIDFFSGNHYDILTTPFAAIYTGVLTIYVGTKEFDRWYDVHDTRHPGELFVIGWTVLITVLFVCAIASGGAYVLSSDIVAVYILVLTIFALTQKSKQFHREHKEQKKRRIRSK